MKFLYKKQSCNDEVMFQDDLDIEVITPTIRRLFIEGEKKSIKLLAARLMFWIITFGKAKLYCYRQGGELAHTSYVIPKCCKFPFLESSDYEIGPCMTCPKFRGKGYYPTMLRYICSTVGSQKTTFYMIVDEENSASIKGIEKAGFTRCGVVEVSKITKTYRLVKSL